MVLHDSESEKNYRRYFGTKKPVSNDDIFLETESKADVSPEYSQYLEVSEFGNPPFLKHYCGLLNGVKLPKDEIDYMVPVKLLYLFMEINENLYSRFFDSQ